MTFVLDGIDALERSFDRTSEVVAEGIGRAVKNGIAAGVAEAKSQHRYKDKTGTLTASIHADPVVVTRTGATGAMKADAKYASYVEEGTKAHEIRPKAGRGFVGPLLPGQSRGRGKGGGMLAWQDAAGIWHRAKVVHHPGTKAYGFMAQAYTKCEAVIEKDVELVVSLVAQTFDK